MAKFGPKSKHLLYFRWDAFLVAFTISHRLCMMSLSSFGNLSAWDVFRTILQGLAADLGFLGVIFLLLSYSRLKILEKFQTPLRIFRIAVSLFLILLLIANFRFLNQFGHVIHPRFFGLATTRAAWSAIIALWWSPSFGAFLGIGLVLGLALYYWIRNRESFLVNPSSGFWLTAAAVSFFVFTSYLPTDPKLPWSLLQHPAFAISVNVYEDYLKNPAPAVLDPATNQKVRQELSAERPWAANPKTEFPFWQSKIWSPAPNNQMNESIRSRLKKFIEDGAKQRGPWNVIMVQQEALGLPSLAKLNALNVQTVSQGPGIQTLLADGVSFDRAYSTSNLTHYAQVASQCSVFPQPVLSTQPDYPTNNMTCLGEVFAHQGYDTFFVCGTDNGFTARDRFHPSHGIRNMVGINQFPGSAPRNMWGVSDRAMYRKGIEILAASATPKFILMQTLTYHLPHSLPADSPQEFASIQDPELQVLKYVDSTFTSFYTELSVVQPHTLVLFYADHNQWSPKTFNSRPSSIADLDGNNRVPLAILSPEFPKELRGLKVETPVADVDIPPTLVTLMGWSDTPNQFMGEDAFRRNEPISIAWKDSWFEVNLMGGDFRVSPWPRARIARWVALTINNRWAPDHLH